MISLVLPFYNEESCVAAVISDVYSVLEASGVPFELIAVQNGSRDRTAEMLQELKKERSHMSIVDIPVNRGFGFGVLQGLSLCCGDMIGYMPGDGQIPPDAVLRVAERMKKEGADIGKGVRFIRNDNRFRRVISFLYNSIMQALFHLPVRDVNASPKLMTASAYRAVRPCSHDFFLDPEILLKARKLGLTICEENIISPERKKGSSKLNVLRVCADFLVALMKARFMKDDPWGINKLDLHSREERAFGIPVKK